MGSDCQHYWDLGGHCAGVDCDAAAALARDYMDDQQQHGQQCVVDSCEKHGNAAVLSIRWVVASIGRVHTLLVGCSRKSDEALAVTLKR